jgi:alpha-tubulin suppressor-like RCC1 family protein
MRFSSSTLQRHMRLILAATATTATLAAALSLSACGGGSDAAGAAAGGAAADGSATAITVFNTSSIIGPARVVANTLQSYSTEEASVYNWQWGDASPSSITNPAAKVWYRSGTFYAAVAWVSGNILGIATQAINVVDPIAAGASHSCALRGDGTVSCWGSNSGGALGDGTFLASTTNASVVGLSNAVAVKAGFSFTCALKSDASVNCWGSNSSGQLGATSSASASASALAVSGLSDAVAIAVGQRHACAIRSNSTVACWGANGYGQLGDGSLNQSNVSIAVKGYGGTGTLSGVVALSLGEGHSCALMGNGTMACWGWNGKGQLGQGLRVDPNGVSVDDLLDSNVPKPVSNFSGVVALASGSPNAEHNCALKADSSVWCWGYNNAGQLGDGTLVRKSTPVAVLGLAGSAAAYAAGTVKTPRVYTVAIGAEHSCAIGDAGLVYCWGANAQGQLGDASNTNSSLPTDVAGAGGAVAISMGSAHSCYLGSDGAVRCWGANDSQQLAQGVGPDKNTPQGLTEGGLGGATFWK